MAKKQTTVEVDPFAPPPTPPAEQGSDATSPPPAETAGFTDPGEGSESPILPQVSEKPEIVQKNLKCALTTDERLKLGELMSQKQAEIDQLQADKKAFDADIKARISAAESTRNSCADRLNAGYEFRKVDCAVERDHQAHEVRTVRLDTGEAIEARNMTTAEMQQTLDLSGD